MSATSSSRLLVLVAMAVGAILLSQQLGAQSRRVPPGTHAFEAYLLQQGQNQSARPRTAPQASTVFPWRRSGYRGYSEPETAIAPPSSWSTASAPQKYTITIEPLPQTVVAPDANIAYVMAHVPDEAVVWFQGQLMAEKGDMRLFRSPPLTPGEDYKYEIKVAWPENGKWVAQMRDIAVHAGDIHCLYIATPEEAVAGLEAKVRDSLAKLSPEDRKLAEQQKFCAVQNLVPLGSMGVPPKVTLKGQTVFLCCAGCNQMAQDNPAKTLAKVQQLRKAAKSPAPNPDE